MDQDADFATTPDLAIEVARMRKALTGLRSDMARARLENHLLRQDVAALYGLLRLVHDQANERARPPA